MTQPVHQVLSFPDSVPFSDFDAHLQRNADATVLIEVPAGQHGIRRGSGIVLHDPSLCCAFLLTCHHVLPTETDAAAAVVKFRYRSLKDRPRQVSPEPGRLFYSSKGNDFTLVAIPRHPHRSAAAMLPACPPARTEAEVEKGIYSLSHPHGAPLCISLAGRRVSVKELSWSSNVAFTSEVHGGSSGGGVYDTQTGALIALITHETPEYNYGTNVKAIWQSLRGMLYSYLYRLEWASPAWNWRWLYTAVEEADAARDRLEKGPYRQHFERLTNHFEEECPLLYQRIFLVVLRGSEAQRRLIAEEVDYSLHVMRLTW